VQYSEQNFELLEVECGAKLALFFRVEIASIVLAGMDVPRENYCEPVVLHIELLTL
jgi:hypothetical protein